MFLVLKERQLSVVVFFCLFLNCSETAHTAKMRETASKIARDGVKACARRRQ